MTNSCDTLRLLSKCGSMDLSMLGPIAAEIEQLRGNLSLAEEGLANATQENASLTTQRDHWLEIAREKDTEIERLQAQLRDCEQLLAAHDPKRECGYWLRTQPPTSEPTRQEPGSH
jgi:hypothetical protein